MSLLQFKKSRAPGMNSVRGTFIQRPIEIFSIDLKNERERTTDEQGNRAYNQDEQRP